MTKYDTTTTLCVIVYYDSKEYDLDEIKDILIRDALEQNFDITIEELITEELP